MQNQITIRSKLFPTYPKEEDEINPGRFGKRLAEHIKLILSENGITVSSIYPTDSSYELRIDQFPFPVYIQAGNMDGEDEEFLIFIEPNKKFVRKFFRKIPTEDIINEIFNLIYTSFQKIDGVIIVSTE
jgi:hypothetical protein